MFMQLAFPETHSCSLLQRDFSRIHLLAGRKDGGFEWTNSARVAFSSSLIGPKVVGLMGGHGLLFFHIGEGEPSRGQPFNARVLGRYPLDRTLLVPQSHGLFRDG